MNYLTPNAMGTDAIARARSVGPSITAAADEVERTQRIPEPLLSQLHAARLCRMFLPRAVDGDELPPWVYLGAIEEISRHDGSVGWNVFVANSSALIAPFLDPDAMQTIFAEPRAIVAWGPPNESKAVAVPGGYRVSGHWSFASGCRQATWMGAHCHVVEPDGSLRLNAAGKPTVRTMLCPLAQAELLHTWNVIGMRGTASDSYALHDLFVPEAFTATREDPTLRRLPGRLYAFPMQGLYAVGVAGVALGIARAMLDEFEALAQRKTPRNLIRLADNAVVQSTVAQMEARLGAARAYLVETLSSIWETADDVSIIDVPSRARVRLACAFAIQTAEAVADYAYKAAGTDAIFLGTAFERRFRDIHTLSQQIQSRTAHFESVGAILLGIEPAGTFL
jgi:alkylation response protein AidB-like acyl-CoA dehydrogenase